MLDNVRADIDRYRFMNRDKRLWVFDLIISMEFMGLWATLDYRARRWIKMKVRVPGIRQLLRLLTFFSKFAVQTTTGIILPSDADIGKGLYIGHWGCVVVNGGSVMGENCNLSQDVTLGIAGRGDERGAPVVGNRVYIAPGVRIIGRVTVGDDVAIGANAVVTKDIPDRAVAVGIPAKVISYDGSADFIEYRHISS